MTHTYVSQVTDVFMTGYGDIISQPRCKMGVGMQDPWDKQR